MPRTIRVLNGEDWRLGQAPPGADPGRAAWPELERVEDWLPATVPGNVHADLQRAGRLPDLAWAGGPHAVGWVDEHHWWLVRDWRSKTGPAMPGQRLHLVLRGVDYVADLFLNGTWLGRHEGMFSPQVYDVTPLIRDENRLAVRFLGARWLPHDRSGPVEKALNRLETRAASLARRYPERRDTLKCQMSFGWDFAPPLLTAGLWDDVALVATGSTFIRDVASRSTVAGGGAMVTVDVELDAIEPGPVRLVCSLQGETFDGGPLRAEQVLAVEPGTHRARLTLAVPEPRLWWPWDQGEPDLYRLGVEVLDGPTGQVRDGVVETVGLRRVELDAWTLRINGRRVYARGASWVPADILPGRTREADYRHLLTLARQANMNMLRVWGGGLREKRPFYDLCDRLGLLVWQEFPLACSFLTRFPRSAGYLRLVRDEVRAIVRDVRNHACVVVWCGGNEFDPARNRPVVDVLRQVVAAEDPERPFLPASPASGDSHYWRVWHNFLPPAAYRQDPSLFASEFGLQSPPGVPALRRFLPENALWPPGRLWEVHGAGLAKLWRYARPFLGGPPAADEGDQALDAFVAASQRAQAHGLQIAIEHYRRAKARGGGGALVWQLNEPWPAISWAIVDFWRQPKPAYEAVRRAFSPLLVSLDYALRPYSAGETLAMDVWLINDTPADLPGVEVAVTLSDQARGVAHQARLAADLPAGSAAIAGRLAWVLPGGEHWRVACRLHRAGQELAANEYELGPHDGIQPTLVQRLWARLGQLVMPR